jgi:hypothetical protein
MIFGVFFSEWAQVELEDAEEIGPALHPDDFLDAEEYGELEEFYEDELLTAVRSEAGSEGLSEVAEGASAEALVLWTPRAPPARAAVPGSACLHQVRAAQSLARPQLGMGVSASGNSN